MSVVRTVITTVLLCIAVAGVHAQSLNKKLSDRYYKTKYDTNYVVRPAERWLLKPSLNQTGTSIHAKGTVKDVWSKYDLRTKYQTTLSMEVDYCDIAVAFSINPAKMKGNYDDYEFNFEYHGNMISFDLDYQSATSLTGDINFGNIDHLDEDALTMKTLSGSLLYLQPPSLLLPCCLLSKLHSEALSWIVVAGPEFPKW